MEGRDYRSKEKRWAQWRFETLFCQIPRRQKYQVGRLRVVMVRIDGWMSGQIEMEKRVSYFGHGCILIALGNLVRRLAQSASSILLCGVRVVCTIYVVKLSICA